MSTDLSTSLAVARTTSTQQSSSLELLKRSTEKDESTAYAAEGVTRPPPAPEGQGLKVDKSV